MSRPVSRALSLLSHLKKEISLPSITAQRRALTMSVRRTTFLATISVIFMALLLRHYGQGNKMNITDWVKPGDKSGEFKRGQSVFRNFIENKPGAQFPPEKGRYSLYVSYACPWAHRTMIVRKLKGLEEIIPVTSGKDPLEHTSLVLLLRPMSRIIAAYRLTEYQHVFELQL
jgi:hypothetical protein